MFGRRRIAELEAAVAEAAEREAQWQEAAADIEVATPDEFGALMSEMMETYTAATRALEDMNWHDVTKPDASETPGMSQPAEVRKAAAQFSRENPIVKQAQNLKTWFTFGTGLSCPTIKHENQATAEAAQAVIEEVWRDPDNRRTLTSPVSQAKLSNKIQDEGDLFLMLFVADNGHTKIRVADANEIVSQVEAPDDRNRILYYVRSVNRRTWNPATHSYNPTTESVKVYHPDYRRDEWVEENQPKRNGNGGEENVDPLAGKEVEEALVYHETINATTNEKTGVPESYSSMAWIRHHREICKDLATLVRALASIAWRKKVSGTATQVAAHAAALRPTATSGSDGGLSNPPPRAGGIAVESDKVKWEAMRNETGGVSNAVEGATNMRRMGITGFGWADHYFANPENANLATASAMELPQMKMIEANQQWWATVIGEVLTFVLQRSASRIGIAPERVHEFTVDVDFPPIVTKDLETFTAAIASARENGTLTRELAAILVMTAFGVNNIPEELTKLLDEPEPEKPEDPLTQGDTGEGHGPGCVCEQHGDEPHNIWECCCDHCAIKLAEVHEAFNPTGKLAGIEAGDFEPLYPAMKAIGIMLQKAKELKRQGATLSEDDIAAEMAVLTKTMDTAMALVVPKYKKLLSPIMDGLQTDMAAALAGSVDPFSLAQKWLQSWPQYGNYNFTRMARTELAFGENDAVAAQLKKDYGATDELLSKSGYGQPPWHPNCTCSLTTLEGSDETIYMVPLTIPSACPACHDIADSIMALVPGK